MRVATIAILVCGLACNKSEKPDSPEDEPPETGDGDKKGGDEELVDLYGDPIPGGAIARLGSVRMLDRALGRLIFSADGSEIITSSEGAYLVWQTTTAQRTGTLVAEDGGHILAMSDDGKVLATSVYGGKVQLWNYAKREAGAIIEAHRREVTDMCFAADGELATASEDQTVKVFKLSASDYSEKLTVRGDWESVTSLACSRAGYLVFADSEGEVIVASLDNKDGAVKAARLGKSPNGILDVAISPDGKHVAAGTEDGRLLIWKTTGGGKPIDVPDAHPRKVLTVAFDGKGKLMTSGGDRFFRIWDPETGDKIAERPAAADVDAQLFVRSPDGNFVAAFSELRDGRASEAGRFWLYDADGKLLLEPDRHHEALTAIAFSPDGKKVITASEDHRVLVWDAISANLLDTLATHEGAVRDLVIDGDVVLSSGDDARMHRSSLGGVDSIILEPIGGAVHALIRSPDGKRIVTGDFVGKVWSFSVGSGAKIAQHSEEAFEQIHDLAFSPDGRYFAVAGASPQIHIVSVASGQKLIALAPDGPRSNHAVAFSPDGKMLATGGDDHVVRLWGTSSWSQLRELEGADGTVRAVVFSPSGKRIAAGSSDQTARVWDTGTAEQVTMLAGHRGAVTALAFSPDGSKLATASRDKTGLIWELPEEPGEKKPGAADKKPEPPGEKKPDAAADKNKPDAGGGDQ
jgi:WD40 repeat protein